MLLVLETPEEEEAIRQGSITISELRDRIKVNNLDVNIRVGVKSEAQFQVS